MSLRPSSRAELNRSPGLSNPSIVNFAVVVDAGSSGSRAYLYGWPQHSGDPHELLKITPLTTEDYGAKPLYKKVTPGLSR